ncbi:hypothetical protein TrCOL_g13240 [Triparma columacea]|uniref:PRP1 splicing factor N-terminal domain-containing protein n=1 Tax=Triparma columacea TaxID=722753 RepID=A0A9W7G6K4_9STRA|nr:hypothetical protein TrCOL_g13240 [Triparma columacea]
MSRTVNTYDGPPPAGYIPGKGRGATGFTTRSDVGSASTLAGDDGGEQYGDGDEEADKIYAAIDEKLKGRHSKRKREKADEDNDGKISDQFKDLKSKLATVSEAEWASLPDVGDRSLKYKQVKRAEIFTPLVDSIMADNASKIRGDTESVLKGDAGGGLESMVGGMASARNKVISMTLNNISDSVGGQTVVDPKGYITSLASQRVIGDGEIGDIKKARLLLKSVRDTNRTHGPGWIAAARVEEYAGDLKKARQIIREGCSQCTKSEDVWLEAARLAVNKEVGKGIVAHAISGIQGSVKLYLKAAEMEDAVTAKKTVLRRGIEAVPNSVRLWRAAIELENKDDARVMLGRAVECVPDNLDMWLALARLETYGEARKVLNKARKKLPGEVKVWITAAKLEEGQGKFDLVDKIIAKSVGALKDVVKRDTWMEESAKCGEGGAEETGCAIVRHAIGLGVEEEDRMRTWEGDAKGFEERGMWRLARETWRVVRREFGGKKKVWIKSVEMEKEGGSREEMEKILHEGVERVPKAEVLWLMLAKSQWVSGSVEQARGVLARAFEANPTSENIWLAGAKLEMDEGEWENARVMLREARGKVDSRGVWMKSAVLERERGRYEECLELLEEGVKKHGDAWKLYVIGGQVCSDDLSGREEDGRSWYERGIKECGGGPGGVILWIGVARLEERLGRIGKARSLLELGRLKNKGSDRLWLESARLERRIGNDEGANKVMAMGLKECPKSGLLWAEEIKTAKKVDQKRISMDAIKNCTDDVRVVCAVALLFVAERKYVKARKWFLRATVLDPSYGDAFVDWYEFEAGLVGGGGKEGKEANKVLKLCEEREPRYGERWVKVRKGMGNLRKGVGEVLKIAAGVEA